MPVRDDLGTRMKEFYEQVPKFRLYRRTPVAIRIDGKAFHTFTRGFQKPFDEVLIKSMQETMKYLCENIQGCVLGYTQSDEITLILVDYKKLNSDAWFDYEIQKICSIAASMATMAFNRSFRYNAEIEMVFTKDEKYKETLLNAIVKGAMFDARCFNIPREEVTNLIYWRQLDATRNSIQMVGQANFSHKELQNKTCNDIQDMLMLQKGINWNDFPTHQKRGSCCIKNHDYDEYGNDWGEGWRIDTEIPIFKGEDRKYIEKLIQPEEE
jgi:tRNA(His) 5'-end guanylyltransferase